MQLFIIQYNIFIDVYNMTKYFSNFVCRVVIVLQKEELIFLVFVKNSKSKLKIMRE